MRTALSRGAVNFARRPFLEVFDCSHSDHLTIDNLAKESSNFKKLLRSLRYEPLERLILFVSRLPVVFKSEDCPYKVP